jgi:hypothetical protein
MKPYQIQANACLAISDIHQDLTYAKSILLKEKGNYDHVVFFGDMFDSHKSHPQVAGIKETARFMKEVCEFVYGPATILASNHDLNYMECWAANQRFSHKRTRFNNCGGFTNSKSIEINKILSWENWSKVRMFCEFGGFVLSHAGFHPSFWNFYKTKEENLDALWEESEDALRSVSIRPSRFFEAGEARGGKNKIGGPIWLDFNEEFVDNTELPPQIVAHTQSPNTVKQKGRSYCIDGSQQIYLLMDKTGEFQVKTIHPSGNWHLENLNYPQHTTAID